MATESMSEGVYVYAVVAREDAGPIDGGEAGLDGAPVYALAPRSAGLDSGGLTALVSRTARTRVRPERRNLAAHNQVLRWALARCSVLPMAFGLIASSDEAVQALLRTNEDQLREQLARVAGRVEMGLRVLWEVPNVFEYFVALRDELREARDALGEVNRAGRGEMLALGQLFERALNEERAAHERRVVEVLARHGVEVHRGAPRGEREVMNLSCLVQRAQQGEFEAIVSEAAAAFDSHFTFDISGPWAPYNFVSLNLRPAE